MTETERWELEAQIEALRGELDASRRQLMEVHQLTAVGQLFAGIIHEINTPIGSILSNNQVSIRSLEMLKEMLAQAKVDGTPPPQKAGKLVDTLVSLAAVDKLACERIIAVVRGLKTMVGGRSVEFRKANLNEIVENTLKLARCEFRRRVQVETDLRPLPEIECDAHQLGQVFLNLLVNAGQAIEGEGKVVVRTRLEGDWVLVSVADNGAGIAPEHRSKVFTSGFTTKAAGVGTGLGLSISREIIVDLHRGTIDFESEVGKGTTFFIRLPVRPGAEAGVKDED